MDVTGNDRDGVWMTYTQLAAARGVKRIAAIRIVQRHKWRKQAGNDGQVRVLVPYDMAGPSTRTSSPGADNVAGHVTGDVAGNGVAVTSDTETVLAALREAHAGEIARLTEALGRAEARAEAATARADAERARADGIADRAHTLEAELAAVEAVRDVERARAHEAEEGREAARRQAEELRIKLAELEAEGHTQTVEAAELSARIKATENAQAEAEAHAAELRQADKERRAGGRWARLRAAWRGE